MRTTNEFHAGFTLLEALVALTILTGTTASIMTLIATNRRAQTYADADLSATLHVRSLLARIGRDLPLEIGTQSGTFDDGQTWSVLITPFKDAEAPSEPKLPLLEVHVRLPQSASRQSPVEVFTLRRASQ